MNSLRQEEEIEALQKEDEWLQTIEDRVLLLHFKKPPIGTPQTHDAQTVSFYGALIYNQVYIIIRDYSLIVCEIYKDEDVSDGHTCLGPKTFVPKCHDVSDRKK